MSKSGFSTLNRWLGRKNKDKSLVNGKLSKSNTNLSISSTNINETSQLEYNRITPLPAATTNAPFEQTFRITVLLPKDQLYVTRLGARVPLSKLLELVCDNKLLDQDKYEFRNPVDPSQVYSCDLTIGAVGLSEIRLCHKSESYDNFNSDEIIKLRRTSLIRESVSSSEFSSRNSKHTTKTTTSPYSSTNSLNSMDSSALSYGRTPKLTTSTQPKMSAPPRKKRAAPRPPSQIAIPEKSPLIMANGVEKENFKPTPPPPYSPLTTKDFSVSTPNLTSSTLMHSDINGNNCNGHVEDYNENSSGNGSLNSNGYSEDTVLYAQVQKKNSLNLHTQKNNNLIKDCLEDNGNALPEPSPRKKIVLVKKKTSAPPAPPPRNSLYQEDAVSLASTVSTPTTPLALTNSVENFVMEHPKPLERMDSNSRDTIPTPQPRITAHSTSSTLLNATNIEQDLKVIEHSTDAAVKNKSNISKVLLNRTPTPEPRSLSCEPPEAETSFESQFEHRKNEDDCVSKQADSGIGEPVPSPLPDSLPSEVSNLDVKSSFESSSDDDDMVKVYNFKLGKTLVKPLNETKTLEELAIMNSCQEEETDSEMTTSLTLTQVPTPNSVSETSSWNFAIPISPPPNFADGNETESKPDTPITPKIMERPVLNFEELKQEQDNQTKVKQREVIRECAEEKPSRTPTTPLDSIVDELNAILQEKALDTLIKTSEDKQEIEAAKPNTLSNFTINAISQTNTGKPKEVLNEQSVKATQEKLSKETSEPDSISSCTTDEDKLNTAKSLATNDSPASIPDEEKLYRKRSSITSLKQRRSITRSDSFHTTAASPESLGLNKRTSSQLSLDQTTGGHLNRRKSSSELSIGESPSLQSLEVMKTILNSRKNSLATSSGGEEDTTIEVNARRPIEELSFASLELKTSKERDTDKLEIKAEVEKPKELPKVYRYSGPPSINFSTWNERPKVQVAIKNEGDYIFGGAQNKEDIKAHRMSTPAGKTITALPPPPVAPKPAVIQRMGIPEKDYKVPITVKPLQDVIVDSVKQKSVQKKATDKQTLETIENANNRSIQRPTVESVLRPQTQFIINTSTLPRTTNRQRFSTPGPQLLRTTSIKKEQQEQPLKPQTATVESPSAPFGQNTLRRTGLKEKIMAKEEQNQEKPLANCFNALQKPLANGDLKYQNNTNVTSAKLHLNLKKTNITTINLNESCKTTTPTHSLETPTLKPKPQTPKTAPALGSSTHNVFSKPNGQILTPTPPPPPPTPSHAAIITTIQLKPVTGQQRTPTTPNDDPRDQLLEAIRSFNKEGLKRT